MNPVSFDPELKTFDSLIEHAQAELDELESQLRDYDTQIARCRSALVGMRATWIEKKVPTKKRGRGRPRKSSLGGARPKRGERRKQVLEACRKIGAGGEPFRTVEVLRELERRQGELSSGLRSYTYTLLNKLEEQGHVTKVGRGKWELTETT